MEYLTDPAWRPLTILLGALLLERLLAVPVQFHPLGFFRAMALGVSAKVHRPTKPAAAAQQKLAGLLSIPTLLLPFLFLIYMMMKVAEFPLLFDTLLLWLCLAWTPLRRDTKAAAKALDKNQKGVARARLAPWLLRKTDNLSPMGLCKAAVEMVMLRSCKEYFAVIFYYITFGAFFALCYRLIVILNQCWNPKLDRYRHFGKAAHWLAFILQWLPSRLCWLTLVLLGHLRQSVKLARKARQWGNDSSLAILSATAGAFNLALGGPVYYNENKLRRPHIASDKPREPDSKAVRQAMMMVEKQLAVWLLFILLVSLIRIIVTR